MPIKQETAQSGEMSRNGNRFLTYFFRTIVMLFLVIAVLLTIVIVRAPSEELIQAERVRVYELLSEYTDQSLGTSFPDTESAIDQQVDIAFAPAYKNIEAFTDAHYTVIGEYTELVLAATGKLEEKIEEILFEGLQERLGVASEKISTSFREELAGNFKAEAEHKGAIDLVIDDMHSRFDASDIALKGSMAIGGGAAGVTITKAISAAIAKKLIAVTAAKTAGKTTVKFAGTASGAGIGATLGSFIPGAGTAAGGIIGGIVGWFLVDKVVVEVDEHFHRADFEKEVASLIDEQKAQVKSSIRKHIEAMVTDVKNKTPFELIRDST